MKPKLLTVIVIILGGLLFSFTSLKSGQTYDFGLGFWGPHGHDSIWHLSLINQFSHGFPLQNPIFSNTILSNYHWGFDLFAYLVSKILPISLLDIYFRVIPIFFSLLIGILSYWLAYKITKNRLASTIFVFLNYFAGSFGWIYTILKNGQLGGESLFWSMQSISALINPPYALSIIMIFAGLILWLSKRNKSQPFWGIVIGLIFGLLTGVKIYAAIIFGLSFSLFFIWQFIKTKKFILFDFLLCLTFGLISISIMFFLGIFSQKSLISFQPLWFVHSLIESQDKLFIPKLASFRSNLSLQLLSYKLPFFLAIEIFLLIVFLTGNLGTRILGLSSIIQKIKTKKNTPTDILLFLTMSISMLIPVFFVQKGTAWNTIQFFYYFLLFFNLYFAITLTSIFQKSKLVFFIILAITIPTTIGTLKDYFGYPPPSSLPSDEVQALNFLKNQPYGTVLTYPYDKNKKSNVSTPIPLYLYETTAYVSAFSGQPTFLADEMNLEITGYNWQKRRQESLAFFDQDYDQRFKNRDFLVNNQITYVYLVGYQKSNSRLSYWTMQLDKIFENQSTILYKVRR